MSKRNVLVKEIKHCFANYVGNEKLLTNMKKALIYESHSKMILTPFDIIGKRRDKDSKLAYFLRSFSEARRIIPYATS